MQMIFKEITHSEKKCLQLYQSFFFLNKMLYSNALLISIPFKSKHCNVKSSYQVNIL